MTTKVSFSFISIISTTQLINRFCLIGITQFGSNANKLETEWDRDADADYDENRSRFE